MQDLASLHQLWLDRGGSEYGGESVTQLEHALQCATLAESEDAPRELIVAALLHDVGHLLHDLPDDAPDRGIDDSHEARGYGRLRKFFPESVCQPIRLHVPAKRYLCAVDQAYFDQLSPPSKVSLELQGGPMDEEELAAFRENEFFDEALRLRRWDDTGKIPDLETPDLEHFWSYVESVSDAS